LEDYLQEHICQPLGLKSTSFISPSHLPESIASRTIAGDSTSEWTEVIYPISSKPEIYSGGGGLYSTAEELSLILAEVLNDGRRLFKSGDTVRLLFESRLKTPAQSALGAYLQYLWATSPATVKAWENAEPTFGLGYLINAKDIETGRKAGTGSWGGISGTAAWIDPQSGIAVIAPLNSLCLSTDSLHAVCIVFASFPLPRCCSNICPPCRRKTGVRMSFGGQLNLFSFGGFRLFEAWMRRLMRYFLYK
jgi:CubicO group peptidase (beta-lactamase class C family)